MGEAAIIPLAAALGPVAGAGLSSMLTPDPAPQTPSLDMSAVGGAAGQAQMANPYQQAPTQAPGAMPTFQASNPFMNPAMGTNPFLGRR